MKNKTYTSLFAVFVLVTLMLPTIAANRSQSTPVRTDSSEPAMMEPPEIATVEGLFSAVDYWGGVNNIVASIQNATEYSNSNAEDLLNIVKDQMTNDDGFVSQAIFEMNGLTPFPNGVVGGPMATLTVTVKAILEVPLDEMMMSFTDLSVSEAISLANQVRNEYDSALGTNLQRFAVIPTQDLSSYMFMPIILSDAIVYPMQYEIVYMDLMTASEGDTVMTSLLSRLATMGGFMDICDSPDWPTLLTQATEAFVPVYWAAQDAPYGYGLQNLLSSMNYPYYRSVASHPEYQETVQSALIGEAGFNEPGYVNAGPGDESYSVLDHVGFTGNLKNKMAEVPGKDSVSIIGGVAPASLDISGIPAEWATFDDSYQIPMPIYLPYGGTMPANSTLQDIIMEYLSHLPKELGIELGTSFAVDPTMFDYLIDSLWASGNPAAFPDFDEYLKNVKASDFPTGITPEGFSINFDMISNIMAYAGMNPTTLMDHINTTLAEENPMAAVALGFIDFFDSYHLLDILQSTNYAYPDHLADYINTFITNLESMLKDVGDVDVPTEFKNKEAIATFVEDHWDITLQALWTAMGNFNDNTGPIKNAVHAMLDSDNLESHIVPYIMADLGTSFASGIGFKGAVNIDDSFTNYTLYDLDTSDLTLTFDANPDSLSVNGPFLVITKTPASRIVAPGSAVNYNITVHNYGSATAYDVKVLDGMNVGLDGDREFYWTRSTLAADATWTIEYSVTAGNAGLYTDLPAICVYFNTTVASYNPDAPEAWTGSSFYAMSAPGYQIQITGSGNWWEGEIFGIPTLYLTLGVGGIAIIGVAILAIRRR